MIALTANESETVKWTVDHSEKEMDALSERKNKHREEDASVSEDECSRTWRKVKSATFALQ